MSTQDIDFDMNFADEQQQEADKNLYVRFFQEAVQNEAASNEAGRPIFDTVDMIEIMYPGRRDTTVGMANHQGYKNRFAKQWMQYSKGLAQTVSGTPLSQVSWLTAGQIAEMKAVNIHSVEQLAGMTDNVAAKFMNHHALKQQAQAFLDQAAGNAPLLKMQAELGQRDSKIAELMAAVEALQKKAEKV
jgi:hypothetical protein